MKQEKELTPLGILREKYPDLVQWIKSICRFDKIEDFIIADYKEPRLHLYLYTKEYCYSISAYKPKITPRDCEKCGGERTVEIDIGQRKKENDYDYIHCTKCGYFEKNKGYLGCIATTRKPRAGEDWNRGNDLTDGSYSEKTWNEIVNDIVAYELVKIVHLNERIKDEDK